MQMQVQNKMSEFLVFLYAATISAGVPIIRTSGKEITPYR